MAQGRPVEANVRERAIELIQSGMPRNALARELTIAPSSVSKIAADESVLNPADLFRVAQAGAADMVTSWSDAGCAAGWRKDRIRHQDAGWRPVPLSRQGCGA